MKPNTLRAWSAIIADDDTPEGARAMAVDHVVAGLDDIADQLEKSAGDLAAALEEQLRRKRPDYCTEAEFSLRNHSALVALGKYHGLSVFGSDWMDVLSKLDFERRQ